MSQRMGHDYQQCIKLTTKDNKSSYSSSFDPTRTENYLTAGIHFIPALMPGDSTGSSDAIAVMSELPMK